MNKINGHFCAIAADKSNAFRPSMPMSPKMRSVDYRDFMRDFIDASRATQADGLDYYISALTARLMP